MPHLRAPLCPFRGHRPAPAPSRESLPRHALAACLVFLMVVGSLASAWGAPAQDIPFGVVAAGVEAFPAEGQPLPGNARAVFIRLSGDAALDTGKPLRVFLDGDERTDACTRHGSRVTLPLPADLAGGPHRLRLMLPVLVGPGREVEWTFTAMDASARPPEDVVRVTHNANRTLYEADVLEVTVEGPPGGRATATLGPLRLDLDEARPGVYRGSHDVTRSDYCMGQKVSAEIRLPEGRIVSAVSDRPARLFGKMFTVRILSPQTGTHVPWDFIIKGRTRPNARISITPSFGGPPSRPGMSGPPPSVGYIARNIGSIEAVADHRGYFEQKFGFPIHFMRVTYNFTVTAIDEKGEMAIPASFTVRMGNKKKSASPPPTTPSSEPKK